MTRKLATLFAATAIFTGITTVTAVFAEESTPVSPPLRTQGMTGDHGGMMNMMGQISPDQIKQMTRMMDKCNHMMESKNGAPTGPDKERAPNSHG